MDQLAALATSGASTIVGLMVSDGWAASKEALRRLLTSNGQPESEVNAVLEASRRELSAGAATDTNAIAEIELEWRNRLRRRLVAEPALAADLQSFIEGHAGGSHSQHLAGDINITGEARDRGSVYQQGQGTQINR